MTTEALLPVAFLAGFFGSGHCFGMCGPLVVILESGPRGRSAWPFRLLYNLGRGTLYVILGAAAGVLGIVLTKIAGVDVALRLLRWIAAGLVIAMGLDLLFNRRLLGLLEAGGAVIWSRLKPLTRKVLPVTSPAGAYAAGLLWGALPCGLVYSSVSLAAASGSGANGGLIMLVFWLGTLPALLFAGASANRVAVWARRPLLRRTAGSLMLLVGLAAVLLPILRHASMPPGGPS